MKAKQPCLKQWKIPQYKLDSIIVRPKEDRDTLKSLYIGKAAGPNLKSIDFSKNLLNHLLFLSLIFLIFSLISGSVPHIWKQANATPIHKKKWPIWCVQLQANLSSKYSQQSVWKILHKYLLNFFRGNNVITIFQSGFVSGDSIVNQLIDIYNTFCKALNEGKEFRAIFCDISKAFHRVWHKSLKIVIQLVEKLYMIQKFIN